MARTVKIGEYQRMQAASKGPNHVSLGEADATGDATQNDQDVAGLDPMTGQVVNNLTGFRNPSLSVPEQLAVLVLQDDISGMPLGQVVGLVRLAVASAHVNATEPEIRDEAERRWQVAQPEQPGAEDAIGAAEGLPLYADAPDEVIASLGQDDPAGDGPTEPKSEDRQPTIADELQALNVEAKCTAEMSLSMIVGRVKDAVFDAHLDAEDADVAAEAERIWVLLDRQRSHTYSVEADGTIRDWRRPDNTPDRGPDVGTTVHTVTDEESRFSGGGADDESAVSGLIPSDADFHGKLYREAPELANIAEQLIDRHGFLSELINCEIRWYWKRKTGVSKGRVKIGFMKRASDLLGHFSGADFIGWLSATTARDGKFTSEQIEAAVMHQLLHIEVDDEGNFISARHDFEGFAAEVRVYGTWTSDLKLGGTAFVAAHQMGLFDATDEDEDDEDDQAAGENVAYGAGCVDCGGTGALYQHAPDCESEFCVGNGDEHSCSRGAWVPCSGCAPAAPDQPYDEEAHDTSDELPTGEEIDAAMTDKHLI